MTDAIAEFTRQFLALYRGIIETFAGAWEMLMLSSEFYYLRVTVIGVFATTCFLVVLGLLVNRFARH